MMHRMIGCPSSITVGSETVACVDQFTDLVSTIDSSAKSEPEIRRRITIAKSAMQRTYKSVWNTHIALSTKLHLYNTCILLIILYASECWAPTKADVARLDAFDQRCLRRILRITWQDHITNIVNALVYLPVSETMSQNRLSMLGQMSRMQPSIKTFLQTGGDDPVHIDTRQSWIA